MISISQKQKELSKLQQQMLALQQELEDLENQNPAYKKRCDELVKERSNLVNSINQVRRATIKSFIEIEYRWRGIKQTPEIVSYKFLLDSSLNDFLKETIVDYNNLDTIFNFDMPDIKSSCSILDDIDKKVMKFNHKVNNSYNQFKEEYLKTLTISNEIY